MGIEPLPITAGKTEIIGNSAVKKNPDEWMIVDIGYARVACSCGVWTAEGGSRTVSFGGLVELISEELQKKAAKDMNLVIEAPLSIAFQKMATQPYGYATGSWASHGPTIQTPVARHLLPPTCCSGNCERLRFAAL